MSKLAKDHVYMEVGEVKLIDMDFAADLGSLTVNTISSINIFPSGEVTNSNNSSSGTRVQSLFDASSGVDGKEYKVKVTITSSGSPAQTFIGEGILKVG